MRIVAGSRRGARLEAPTGSDVRPTTDRVRESLFGMLEGGRFGDPLVGADGDGLVVDMFAGTGALGLEALSRGAARAVFVEKDRTALEVIRRNVAALRFEGEAEVIQADATRFDREAPGHASLVLLDPPYGEGLAAPALMRLQTAGWLGEDTLIVIECGRHEDPLLGSPADAVFERVYGQTRILLARVAV
jgi:16S rRNA (guanine966-N2)-methyltransferase